jgi:hypothetical protein
MKTAERERDREAKMVALDVLRSRILKADEQPKR